MISERTTPNAPRTELHEFVAASPLCSTHEHTEFESAFAAQTPDVLDNIFNNYVLADLVTAGAEPEAVLGLIDRSNPDVRSRFNSVAEAWEATRHTGYGRASALTARQLYGLDQLDADRIEGAQRDASKGGSQAGERLRLLRDLANLDHVQIDHMDRHVPAEALGQDFFLYDINVCRFCEGTPELDALFQETGIEANDLDDLVEAMEKIFEQNADVAVAVKSQHAYHRTLFWQQRPREEAEAAFQIWKQQGINTPCDVRQCLGDWLWARTVELTVKHNLPFKLHTGYYAGWGTMNAEFIRPAHLCDLLQAYPKARFVLMHAAYPYDNELIAIAKHFPNVVVDLCWAWSINPRVAGEFVRRFLHAVPANKLFAFGGDNKNPAGSVGYALQTRDGLARALQGEVDEGQLTERAAIDIAERFMMRNQYEYFDIPRKKEASKRATEARWTNNPGLAQRARDVRSVDDFDDALSAPGT